MSPQDSMKIVFGMVVPLIVAIVYLAYFDLNSIRFNNSSVPIKFILILIPALLIINFALSIKYINSDKDYKENDNSANIQLGHFSASIIATLLSVFAFGRSIFK